jgi:uncharacterized protein YcfL
MKKVIGILFFFLIFLVGCKNEDVIYDDDQDDSTTIILADDIPTRKIIYEVNMSIHTTNLQEIIDDLPTRLESDEWFDRQSISDTFATFTIRIKTERLDSFIASMKEEYNVYQYDKTGTDISLQYQDKSNRILAIEAQIDRLLVLYDNASLSDMIVINNQLSTLEVELQRLNGELAVFDSLVDYSEVNITIRGSRLETESPFIARVGVAFISGWKGLITFFQEFVIVIVTILPFGILVGGLGFGVRFFIKRRNRKADLKKQIK